MMSHTRHPFRQILKRPTQLALAMLLLFAMPGCNYFIVLGYLIGGPPQVEPAFEKATGKSFTDRNVQVAVVCYAPDDLTKIHDNIDQMLPRRLTLLLTRNHIKTISPMEVQTWMENNPDWDNAVDIGREFDVNYVVFVDMSTYSMYEPPGHTLFRGRCEAIVSVYEMETDGDGKRIYNRELNSVYPIQVPRSAAEISYETFRNEYFNRLAEEVGRLFYPHGSGDDITSAT